MAGTFWTPPARPLHHRLKWLDKVSALMRNTMAYACRSGGERACQVRANHSRTSCSALCSTMSALALQTPPLSSASAGAPLVGAWCAKFRPCTRWRHIGRACVTRGRRGWGLGCMRAAPLRRDPRGRPKVQGPRVHPDHRVLTHVWIKTLQNPVRGQSLGDPAVLAENPLISFNEYGARGLTLLCSCSPQPSQHHRALLKYSADPNKAIVAPVHLSTIRSNGPFLSSHSIPSKNVEAVLACPIT